MLAVSTPPPNVRRSVFISPRKPKQFANIPTKKNKIKSLPFWKREKSDNLNTSTVSEFCNDEVSFEPYEETFLNKQATAVAAALMNQEIRRKPNFLKTVVSSPIKTYNARRRSLNNNAKKVSGKTIRSVSLTTKSSKECTLVKSKANNSTVSLCTLHEVERLRRPGARFGVFSRKWKHRVMKRKNNLKHSEIEGQGQGNPKFIRTASDRSSNTVVDVSLQIVLRDSEYSGRFRSFLKKEYSEENFDFWMQVEEFRRHCTFTSQNDIYNNFIKSGSLQEVNLSFETKVWTKNQMLEISPNCFDRAQRDIYRLMEKDSFHRFILSITC